MDYDSLLARARENLKETKPPETRLELPQPEIIVEKNRTVFRNFAAFPKVLRRDESRFLAYLAKELGTSASMSGERAIFIGKKDAGSFSELIQRYLKNAVICPVCGSPDTSLERSKRMYQLVCEACGARSVAKLK